MVHTCVITGFGINADEELVIAFELAESQVKRVHINDLIRHPGSLEDYSILAFPGGFSFGDHLGSGKVFANLFKRNLRDALRSFVARGGLVIGICNGFQVLVKMGFLPNTSASWTPEVSLIHNDSGRFEDRWVRVRFNSHSPCVWTKGLQEMELPVRHGEGKFVTLSEQILWRLQRDNLVAMTYSSRWLDESSGATDRISYPDNPNGSEGNIAGICDPTGRIIGLMPHPEAFIFDHNHPRWSREEILEGFGLRIFKNGVEFARLH
jgi:phosphoribosylformylglycinamidine synthase